jgi:chromosome segregation ATPase
MADLDQLKHKVDNLIARHARVTEKKAKLKGQLEAKKAELLALGEEIQAAGFDPRKLKEERDRAHQELEDLIEAFERELTEVEEAIAAFEQE